MSFVAFSFKAYNTAMTTVASPPLFKKPLLGFRCWEIDCNNKVLLASTKQIAWQTGVNYAAGCKGHSSPSESCHCGFNAYYDIESAKNSFYSSSHAVIGAMAGNKKIMLHPTGFRSSEAQILALFYEPKQYTKEMTQVIKEIASRYSIPLFTDISQFTAFLETLDLLTYNNDEIKIALPKEECDDVFLAPSPFTANPYFDLHKSAQSHSLQRPVKETKQRKPQLNLITEIALAVYLVAFVFSIILIIIL